MSEEIPIYAGARSFTDRDCSVSCDPVGDHGDFDLTISFEGGVRVRLPMTPQRAKALGRLLAAMLAETGEAMAEPAKKPTPLHPRSVSLKSPRP
jgi:hypothetical protein